MTYTLFKDLPYLKAGAEYVKCSNLGEGNFYMPNVSGMKHETFFIHKDWVETILTGSSLSNGSQKWAKNIGL